MENKGLRGIAADYERVKRAFGAEEVERAVEDAKRREAAEKEQRKAKRKFRPCLENKSCTKQQVCVNYPYGNETICAHRK